MPPMLIGMAIGAAVLVGKWVWWTLATPFRIWHSEHPWHDAAAWLLSVLILGLWVLACVADSLS